MEKSNRGTPWVGVSSSTRALSRPIHLSGPDWKHAKAKRALSRLDHRNWSDHYVSAWTAAGRNSGRWLNFAILQPLVHAVPGRGLSMGVTRSAAGSADSSPKAFFTCARAQKWIGNAIGRPRRETLKGSFSTVLKPIFARKCSLGAVLNWSGLQDSQDVHNFFTAPNSTFSGNWHYYAYNFDQHVSHVGKN